MGGTINEWQPYVGIGSGIMVELLLAQFLIGTVKKYTPMERGGKLKKTVNFLKVAIDF